LLLVLGSAFAIAARDFASVILLKIASAFFMMAGVVVYLDRSAVQGSRRNSFTAMASLLACGIFLDAPMPLRLVSPVMLVVGSINVLVMAMMASERTNTDEH